MDNIILINKERENLDEGFFYQKIRKDLIEQELSVPVGDDYLFTSKNIKCKWFNEGDDNEYFAVFHDGKWQEAYSIDFE